MLTPDFKLSAAQLEGLKGSIALSLERLISLISLSH